MCSVSRRAEDEERGPVGGTPPRAWAISHVHPALAMSCTWSVAWSLIERSPWNLGGVMLKSLNFTVTVASAEITFPWRYAFTSHVAGFVTPCSSRLPLSSSVCSWPSATAGLYPLTLVIVKVAVGYLEVSSACWTRWSRIDLSLVRLRSLTEKLEV